MLTGSGSPGERHGDVAPSPGWPALSGRLTGLDVARALAFGGMLLAHFAVATGRDPGWLQAVDNAADGRAAPLFCILLGVGAGILVARGRRDGLLVRRGAALLVLGLLIWPLVAEVYLILPHYGLLLALVPALRRLPDRALLPVAGAAFAVPSVVVATAADHGLRAAPQPDSYVDLLDVAFLLRHLAWTGGYPLVGWVGFALVGLWVARLPLGRRGVQLRLLLGGAAVAALQPVAAWAQDEAGGALPRALLETSAHSNQLAWYLVASGSAVAVIGGCLLVGQGSPAALRPVAHLGRLMLSAYVLHLVVGSWLVWDWVATQPPLAHQVLVALLVLATFALAADRWATRWRRGPLEAVLRAVAP